VDATTTVIESNASVPEMQLWGEDAHACWQDLAARGPVVPMGFQKMVTTAAAVEEVLHDPERFSSNPDAVYLGSDTGLIPLQVDPPDHVRYRRMLDPLFTPRKMALLEDQVAALVNRCIDGFIERGACDFSEELAVPVPSGTFLQLMGLPLDRLPEFLRVKDDLIRPDGNGAEQDAKRGAAAQWVFALYGDALDARRRQPADDLMTHFATLEDAGDLTREECLNICHLLFTAGLDTVTDTLECSMAFLARHPDHRRQLAQDPALIPHAVEELLRYETPVPTIARVVMADTELEGCPVHKDDKIGVLLANVNLDPTVFPEPLTVDFRREANRHVSFGAGVHRCLGSHLARMELRVVLREWHRRVPDYRLPDGHVLLYSPSLREIRHLALEFTPGRSES
jgi:cytochrome P450